MVSRKQSIVWDIEAAKDFKSAYQFIKKESPHAATKVRKEILFAVRELKLQQHSHPPDKFKIDNDGSYRALKYIVTG